MASTVFVNGVTLTDAPWFQDVNDFIYSGSASAALTNSLSTFTATLTGCTTAPTFTVRYTRIGNHVILTCPRPMTGLTSNATTKTLTGMPATIRPATQLEFYAKSFASDNGGAQAIGALRIATSGVISMFSTFNQAVWTASGTCDFGEFTLSYTLA